ncbi:MAG: hypothetical protein BWZ10_01642 [candidate division BRC1 bacterium ADurb.BinA364]|nr:MAG: hypothetical protein BWZ10_01642 [candidate division BRC1 bacterium ADurb.BinA364]
MIGSPAHAILPVAEQNRETRQIDAGVREQRNGSLRAAAVFDLDAPDFEQPPQRRKDALRAEYAFEARFEARKGVRVLAAIAFHWPMRGIAGDAPDLAGILAAEIQRAIAGSVGEVGLMSCFVADKHRPRAAMIEEGIIGAQSLLAVVQIAPISRRSRCGESEDIACFVERPRRLRVCHGIRQSLQ